MKTLPKCRRLRIATTWAVIPAKAADAAKSRLAPALTTHERAELARRLLAGTIGAALSSPSLAGVVVVSADAGLRALAAALGAETCADPFDSLADPHNAAVAAGSRHALASGAGAVLVLPSDLPLLASEVIDEFLDEAGDAAVALAPDRIGTGTNALLLRPPLAIDPQFGPNSFVVHRAAARARGLSVAVVRLPELALDVDTPSDLALVGWRTPLGANCG